MNDNAHESHDHHEEGFISKYIFSLDHKMIGKQFLIFGLVMLMLGGGLALLIRWQQGYPERPLPIIGVSKAYQDSDEPATRMDKWWYKKLVGLTEAEEDRMSELEDKENRTAAEDKELAGLQKIDENAGAEDWLTTSIPNGVIDPAFYNVLFTMHATIMVFFVVVPLLVGAFGNFLIPLMIGTRDMAFPVLNMLSFWSSVLGALIMMVGFFVPGGHAAAGWTGYAPLSTIPELSGVEWGQNIWCISLIVMGISSLMGSINYITTVINMRAPGMTFFRLPLSIWSLFIVAILLLLAFPVVASALAMMLFDRMAGTTFFSPEGGGEPLLWQHLFWFFGHPEVYILILPGMGLVSDMLSVFSRKPIFGYKSMVYAMIAIAFLGWIVWGHHMFQSGMNPALGAAFMTSTMLIAVPSAIKTFNWLATLFRGSIRFTVPMLNSIAFVSMFVIGGLSGIYMANTPVDIQIHDTYYIVAHIHYVVFGGSVFAIFGAIFFWFPKMFGRHMNETLGKIHFWISFVAFNCTFFPMHILGIGGHMRRVANPTQYEFLQPLQGMNIFITMGAFTLGVAQIILLVNVFWSMKRGKVAEQNPWEANTLEWYAPTPVPHGNFGAIPQVYHGPYEYSVPGMDKDWLPQTEPGGEPAHATASAD